MFCIGIDNKVAKLIISTYYPLLYIRFKSDVSISSKQAQHANVSIKYEARLSQNGVCA